MKTVIELAREIFDVTKDGRGRETFSGDSFGIERMAALVAVIEREACAKECERMMMYPNAKQKSAAHQDVWAAAKAIRARGSNT